MCLHPVAVELVVAGGNEEGCCSPETGCWMCCGCSGSGVVIAGGVEADGGLGLLI